MTLSFGFAVPTMEKLSFPTMKYFVSLEERVVPYIRNMICVTRCILKLRSDYKIPRILRLYKNL